MVKGSPDHVEVVEVSRQREAVKPMAGGKKDSPPKSVLTCSHDRYR